LLFLRKPLTTELIEESKNIHSLHVIPELSERYSLESILFTLANRDIRYERVQGLSRNIRNLGIEQLYNPGSVFDAATTRTLSGVKDLFGIESVNEQKHTTKTFKNIFAPAIEFMKAEGGALNVAQNYLNDPKEYRRYLVKNVKEMGEKLASMWYLCLGGDGEIMTLDRHVCRQAANIGADIGEEFYLGKVRSAGKRGIMNLIETMHGKRYIDKENEIINILKDIGIDKKYVEFSGSQGINGTMITAMFWWIGVKHHRRYKINEHFSKSTLIKLFPSPYTKIETH